MSPPDALEAPPVQVETPQVDAILEGFGEGLYDLSLLPLYLNHPTRNMWDGEVKLICIYSLKHIVTIFNVFDGDLLFCRTVMLQNASTMAERL